MRFLNDVKLLDKQCFSSSSQSKIETPKYSEYRFIYVINFPVCAIYKYLRIFSFMTERIRKYSNLFFELD